jgi:hypothetical protein
MSPFSKKLAVVILSFSIVPPVHAVPVEPFISPNHAQSIYKNLIQEHWVPETGLFLSFLRTQDHKLEQQSSTYDQAAMGILAIRLGDIERAQGIFRFLKSAWLQGPLKSGREGVRGLANFYNAEFGGDGIEKTIHMGPNAWAALFAARLGNKTGNTEAYSWAMDVAHWIGRDLARSNGAAAMGPLYGPDGIPWPKVFSTENNISYYALLAELLRAPKLSNTDRAWLTDEKNRVETWLVTTAFDRLAYTMNRGTNPQGPDRTRALDTITWLVSALGPARLQQRGIDPDKLMRQTEESFEVTVRGLAGVDATDQPEADLTFALTDQGVGRTRLTRPIEDKHRLIWFEGLGQYINSLNTMAAYFNQMGDTTKAERYTQKARHLTKQFDLTALKNAPPRSAYAYATYGKFFHDGWYSPIDAPDGPPSSLIASIWRCYAGLGLDPLAGNDIAGVPEVAVNISEIEKVAHLSPSVLYGASDDMVIQAWQYLEHNDYDRAIQQARATIQEWAPWAIRLQERKAMKVGRLIDYTGRPEERREIFRYWALNDVAAAYYILGKAFDQKSHYPQASGAFRQLAQNFPLAQIWDPRGWFWSPLESIKDDYISRDPRRYGNVLPQLMAGSPITGKLPN